MAGPDPLVGKTLADRFEILERIGEGGTGVVYRAKQLSVDRVIAIKVLGAHVSTDPSWVKRFHNEARAASRLDHPNTVRLIDFGQTKEGLLFIAMEFLSGRSLRAEIEKLGRLPPNRLLRILSQMCASMSEAHNHVFFSSRRRHTRFDYDWSSDVCSSDLPHSTRSGSPDCSLMLLRHPCQQAVTRLIPFVPRSQGLAASSVRRIGGKHRTPPASSAALDRKSVV